MVNHLGTVLFSLLLLSAQNAWPQGLPGQDAPPAPESASPSAEPAPPASASDNELEELYDKDEAKPAPKANLSKEQKSEMRKMPDAQNLSDLARLAPFSDVAVIEKRFLPKTNRFEASASAFTNLNNPFFASYGVDLGLAYYFREKWAIEAIGDFATTAARQVTTNLAQERNITTSNLVTSNGFFGGAIKWNPIYGKMTWLNKSIVPFDLNFSAGGGVTHTVDGQSVPTLHIGTSQVFAVTKAIAVRWDLNSNIYQANAIDDNGLKTKVTQVDLYLGLGMSFYFPEASYR